MTDQQKYINSELFPRCYELEPMIFDGFAYSMSSYPLEIGELLYFCFDEVNVPLRQRRYIVGICQQIDDDIIVARSAESIVTIPVERTKRLVMTIPVGTVNNPLAN